MASPKKKWLRMKAAEDAAKAAAEVAENDRQVSEAKVAAATKASIKKTTSTRNPSRRRTNRN
jgi:hypothetical protein